MAELPAGYRLYGEVVVTVADGLAHRPAWTQVRTGTTQRWDDDLERMVDVPTFGLEWRPGCLRISAPDENLPKIRHYSAGWAHHLGHAACGVCWPSQ